jgi:hypothetical protein
VYDDPAASVRDASRTQFVQRSAPRASVAPSSAGNRWQTACSVRIVKGGHIMRRQATSLTAAGALAASLLLGGVPYAQMQGQQGGMGTGTGNPGAGTAGQQQRDPAGGYYQMHQASGTITKLEENAGRVTIRLNNGEDVKLNLPSTALQQFDDGDRVTVRTQLTLAERTGTGAGSGTRGSGAGAGTTGGTGTGTTGGTGAGAQGGTNR